jgi:hypothetical protein
MLVVIQRQLTLMRIHGACGCAIVARSKISGPLVVVDNYVGSEFVSQNVMDWDIFSTVGSNFATVEAVS